MAGIIRRQKMKRILCFGDSNTWGYDYVGGGRFGDEVRWTGVLEAALGSDYKIIEEGLCGRTTVFEDPLMTGRNGAKYFEPMVCSHLPIDCLVMMLGTNDMKRMFSIGAEEAAAGAERMIMRWKELLIKENHKNVPFILVSPVHIFAADTGVYMYGFDEKSEAESKKFAEAYKLVAERQNCLFVDAALVTAPCKEDGVHLDAGGHRKLGEYLAEVIRKAE